MDNVTHSLTGLALARVGLDRLTPRATLLILLSANVPDVDILALTRGQLAYLEAHRGYTHSFLLLPAMAAACVLVAAAIYRQKLPWLRAWLLCCLGVGSHLLLDWTNSYGVRPLIPFSSRWFHLDLNGLYDGIVLSVLIAAAVWPSFARLVSSEIGGRAAAGRGNAIFALTFFVLFDIGRATLHQRAIAQLEARLYDGMPAVSSAAFPELNPFRWRGVVETTGTYLLMPVDVLRQLDTESGTVFYKPAITDSLQNAQATEPFRYFLYFARFPVWSEEPVILMQGTGKRLELTDLRFGTPHAASFHCIALENGSGQVLGSWFTFGSGRELGRADGADAPDGN
jgi:inner membrane protein